MRVVVVVVVVVVVYALVVVVGGGVVVVVVGGGGGGGGVGVVAVAVGVGVASPFGGRNQTKTLFPGLLGFCGENKVWLWYVCLGLSSRCLEFLESQIEI